MTYSEVVNIGGKGHHDRRSDALLQHAAQLALGVDLSAERRHAEVVLGANGSDTLLLQATAHDTAGGGNEAEAQIDTSLDLVRKSLPESRVQSAHGSLELSSGNPVLGLVSGAVGNGAFGTLGQRRALVQSLHTEGELGSDGLKVATDVDASHATLQERGVEHLQGCAEIVASVLVLELSHILAAGGDGDLRLRNKLIGPAEVEASGKRAFVIEVALAEDLLRELANARRWSSDMLRRPTFEVPYIAAKVYGLMRSPIANW